MNEYSGSPLETHQAWEMLDRWRTNRQEIGVIFWGRTANVYTLGLLQTAAKGRIQIQGEGARATFNLTGATFSYGPMQTWPRWPSPPIVEVNALRAEFANADYLALAEGLTPSPVAPPAIEE